MKLIAQTVINLQPAFGLKVAVNVNVRKASMEMVKFVSILTNANLAGIFCATIMLIVQTLLDRTSVPVELVMKATAKIAGLPIIVYWHRILSVI